MRTDTGAEAALRELAEREDDFRPAWWLPGPHLQSVWGVYARKPAPLGFRREALELPDGDEVVLDHVDGRPGSARVVLLHGFEGSSHSTYVQGLAALAVARGWSLTAMNFRHCARRQDDLAVTVPNRLPRLYHSGDSADVTHVLRTLKAREPGTPLLAAGASLGGSVLMKAMGEEGGRCPLAAAMVISVPYDLAAGAENLNNTMGRIYLESFLRSLRPKLLGLIARFPEVARRVDFEAVSRSRSFIDLDNRLTSPLHGFADAGDYYARCSALGFVQRVTVPTLCLTAGDDPFVAPGVADRLRRVAPASLRIVHTAHGGHVGFVGGTPWSPHYWFERLFVAWMERWAHAGCATNAGLRAAGEAA